MTKTCSSINQSLKHLIVTKNASLWRPEFIPVRFQVLMWWLGSLMNWPRTAKLQMPSEIRQFFTLFRFWILMELQGAITELTPMGSTWIVVTSTPVQKIIVRFMLSKRSSCICMQMIVILVFLTCMHMLLGKACSFMEIQRTNLKNKLRPVSFQRSCLWTPRISNMKAAISHKKTCMWRIEEIMCQNRAPEG